MIKDTVFKGLTRTKHIWTTALEENWTIILQPVQIFMDQYKGMFTRWIFLMREIQSEISAESAPQILDADCVNIAADFTAFLDTD